MFTYLTMIFTVTKAFSREFTNQLNRFKKSTRANSRIKEKTVLLF
jgi:hypothetical protein